MQSFVVKFVTRYCFIHILRDVRVINLFGLLHPGLKLNCTLSLIGHDFNWLCISYIFPLNRDTEILKIII